MNPIAPYSSFQRKWGSSGTVSFHWIPAFAGLAGKTNSIAAATVLALVPIGVDAAEPEAPPTVETPEPPAHASTISPRIRLGGRVHAGYRYVKDEPVHEFELQRARLSLDVEPTEWLRGQIDLSVTDAPPVRDGFVRVTLADWLRITAGQFKKPFSRIELTGPGTLPTWRRGIVNERLTEDFQYGDRDIGVMGSGKLGIVRYAAGVFNGSGTDFEINSGKDANARVTMRPFKALRLGTSVSFRYKNDPGLELPNRDFWAVGIDSRIRWEALDVVAEIIWAQQDNARRRQNLGAVVMGSWGFALSELFELRPVIKLEFLDADLYERNDASGSVLLGLNLHVGDHLRLMLQYEEVFTQDDVDELTVPEERFVVLQLALDYKLWIGGIPGE